MYQVFAPIKIKTFTETLKNALQRDIHFSIAIFVLKDNIVPYLLPFTE